MNLIEVKCPSCGGQLNISSNLETIYCNYCGNKFMVPKSPKDSPDINNYMSLAKTAEDSGDHEDAISYFNKVLEIDPDNIDAWIGKGYSIFFNSSLASPKLIEMVKYFKKGYEVAPQDKKEYASNEIKAKTFSACKGFFEMSQAHYKKWAREYSDYDSRMDNIREFLRTFLGILDGINEILALPSPKYDPLNIELCKLGIFICNNDDSILKREIVQEKINKYQLIIQKEEEKKYKEIEKYWDEHPEELETKIYDLQSEIDKKSERYKESKDTIDKDISKFLKQRNELGLLSFSKKSGIDNNILELKNKIVEMEIEISNLKKQLVKYKEYKSH